MASHPRDDAPADHRAHSGAPDVARLFRAKFERRQADDATWKEDSHFDRIVNLVTRFGQPDHAILRHLPALRDAVEKAAGRIQAV
jgi:hypothetical protein